VGFTEVDECSLRKPWVDLDLIARDWDVSRMRQNVFDFGDGEVGDAYTASLAFADEFFEGVPCWDEGPFVTWLVLAS